MMGGGGPGSPGSEGHDGVVDKFSGDGQSRLAVLRADYEAMRQVRQDARDTVRWRLATLLNLTTPERDMPKETRAWAKQCITEALANLDASWGEI